MSAAAETGPRLRRAGSLHRNSAWIMLTIVLTSLLGYAYWLLAARLFAPAQIGLANGLVSLMTITAIVANLGTAPALVHRLPQAGTVAEWSRSLSASLIAGAVVGAVAGALVLAALPLLSPQLGAARGEPLLWPLFLLGTAACICSTVLDYAFIAERRSGGMSLRGAAFGLVKLPLLALPAAAFGTGHGMLAIFASWALAYAISCALGLLVMVPRIRPGFRLHLGGTLGELRAGGRLLAGSWLVSLGNALPVYLLPVIVVTRLSAAANAYFYITWMAGGIFFMISSAIGSSLFAEGSNQPARLSALTRSSARMTAVLLTPAILIVLLAGEIVLGLFGAAYAAHGTHLLWVLTIASIPDAITNLYVPVLRVRGRLRAAGALTMGMAGAALAGAWLIAPGGGLTGIGLVWLAAQSLGSVWVGLDAVASRRRLVGRDALA